MEFKKLQEFDWRSLNKYTSPKAMDDLNAFLEKLPQNTNKYLLITVAVIWSAAGVLGLFTAVKMQEFAEISVEREEAKSLLPNVPQIKNQAVNAKAVKDFVDELQEIYKGLEIKGNSSDIIINAKSTAQFGQFREAVGHIQNGGDGWRVDVKNLCVGRECKQYPLSAVLNINSVTVEKVANSN